MIVASLHDVARRACVARDAADPLRGLRDRFVLPEGIIYLDGNSLGPMPRAAAGVLGRTIEQEWGHDLIRSWNSAGWFDMPVRLGDRVGALIGAAPGQTARLRHHVDQSLQGDPCRHRPAARSRRGHRRGWLFPDRSLHRRRRDEVRRPSDAATVDRPDGPSIDALLDRKVAVAVLSHVDYRTGALLDIAAITRQSSRRRRAGGLGPLSFDRRGRNRLRPSRRRFRGRLHLQISQRRSGIPGLHCRARSPSGRRTASAIGLVGSCRPVCLRSRLPARSGIKRFLCGTQPIISLRGVDVALDAMAGVEVAALRQKSLALTELFMARVAAICCRTSKS